MKQFAKIFAHMFDPNPTDSQVARNRQIHREWDRQRSKALTPTELAEIDAIFARNL